MTVHPSMRASDADREAVADRLRDAHVEGRLSLEEFQERLDRALAAKTLGELAGVTADLPASSAALGTPIGPAPAHPMRYVGRGHVRRLWAAWSTVMLINVVIWGAVAVSSDHAPYFWPIWVGGPWGAVLLARTFLGAERERPGRQDGERDHR